MNRIFVRRMCLLGALGLTTLVVSIPSMTAGATSDPGGDLVMLTPTRIANTANGTGGLGSTPFTVSETRSLVLTGSGGLPTQNVAAVVLELNASNSGTPGTLSMYSDDMSLPPTTALAYPALKSASGFTFVQVGSDGGIKITSNEGTPDVALTVQGYFTASAGSPGSGGYVSLPQVRILDATATPIPAGGTIDVPVIGNNGVPMGASAIFANVVATASGGSGGLTIWPTSETEPSVPSLRWNSGTSSSGASLDLGSTGTLRLHNTGNQAIGVTLDLDGYFTNGSTAGSEFIPVNDLLFDSSSNGSSTLGAGQVLTVPVALAGDGLPDSVSMVSAALVVAVRGTTSAGTLTVYPSGSSRPSTSDVSYTSLDNVSALTLNALGTSGAVDIYNSGTAAVSLNVSAQGWFLDPAVVDQTGDNFGSELYVNGQLQ